MSLKNKYAACETSSKYTWSASMLLVLLFCFTRTLVGQDVLSIEEMRNQIERDWATQNFSGSLGIGEASFPNALPGMGTRFVGADGVDHIASETPTQIANFGFPTVQLTRGDKTYEISFHAFQQSGYYAQAIRQSPTLEACVVAIHRQSFSVQRWRDYQAEIKLRIHKEESQRNQMNKNPRGGDSDLLNAQDPKSLQAQKVEMEKLAKQRQDTIFEIHTQILMSQQRLVEAQADFIIALEEIGLNGAQVAVVRKHSAFSPVNLLSKANPADVTDEFVLLKANGRSTNNTGYSVSRIRGSGELGTKTVPSEYLLPTPANPLCATIGETILKFFIKLEGFENFDVGTVKKS